MSTGVDKSRNKRKNFLLRVKDVHDLYSLHKVHDGITNEWIYWSHIYPTFHISKGTFYNYLNINVKAELREFETQNNSN